MTTSNEIKPAAPAEGLDGGRCAVDALFGVWRDIETAPRDETEILIKTDIGIVTAWFHSEPGECYQWVCYDDLFTFDGDDGRVTHWMPLPASPNDAHQPTRRTNAS